MSNMLQLDPDVFHDVEKSSRISTNELGSFEDDWISAQHYDVCEVGDEALGRETKKRSGPLHLRVVRIGLEELDIVRLWNPRLDQWWTFVARRLKLRKTVYLNAAIFAVIIFCRKRPLLAAVSDRAGSWSEKSLTETGGPSHPASEASEQHPSGSARLSQRI
jgi:hypothetical protein